MIPGFVDSHTHLVFAGDRGDEFAARMAGAPYAAGGIRVTTDATRAASTEELARLAAARRDEALRAGITHLEIKSGYGLDVETERRSCEVAARFTDDVTFLGAHVVPADTTPDDYVALVMRRHARGVRAARPLDRRLLRGGRVRRRPVARGARGRPRRRARPPGPRQPARARAGRPARRRARRRLGRPLHLPDRRRRRRARRRRHGRHLPPRHRLLHPPALPRRPPRDRRRRARRDRHQLQPRLELHDLDGVLPRARGPRHAHDRPTRRCWQPPRAAPAPSAAPTSATSPPAPAPTSRSSTPPPTPTSSTGPVCRS